MLPIKSYLSSRLGLQSLKEIITSLVRGLPIIAVVILIFLITHSYPFTVDGDGLTHTIVCRSIAETGALPQHHPYSATDVTTSGPQYFPISYPILFYLIGAVFWRVGGLEGMKLMPVAFALVTAVFGYLLFSKVSKRWAPLVAGAMVLVNLRTFIQPVLIEQLLLPVSLVAIYSYSKSSFFNKEGAIKYTLISGLFLGLAVALKQQGMVLLFAIFLHATLLLFYRRIKGASLGVKNYLILFFTGILTCAPFIYELALRNGTPLGAHAQLFPQIVEYFPFLKSRYVTDLESYAYYKSILGYFFSYRSIFEPAIKFLSYPISYETSSFYIEALYVPFSFILIVAGSILLYLRNKSISTMLIVIMLAEICMAYWATNYVQQYHQLGLSIIVLVISSGFVFLFRFIETIPSHVNLTLDVADGNVSAWSLSLRKRFKKLLMTLLTISLFLSVIVSTKNLYASVIERSWGAKVGRLNYQNANQYLELGVFVQREIPQNAIILGASAGFKYYGRRTLIWPTWFGGGKLPKIWMAKTSDEALRWLEYYNVSYIFIDRRQLSWRGASDWIPSDGLVSFIDSSVFFKKIYESSDGILELYQVRYHVQPIIVWESTAYPRNWTYTYSQNLFFNATELSEGGMSISVQGSGNLDQYVRYERHFPPITMSGDEYVSISWYRSSADIETAMKFINNDTFVVQFPENITGYVTTIVPMPAKIAFDTVSANVIVPDHSYESGYVQFNSIVVQRGKSI